MPEGLPQPSSPCSATSRTIWPSSVACRRIPSRPTGAIWSSWPRSSHGTTPPGRRPVPDPAPVPGATAHARICASDDRAPCRSHQDVLSMGRLGAAGPRRSVPAPRPPEGRASPSDRPPAERGRGARGGAARRRGGRSTGAGRGPPGSGHPRAPLRLRSPGGRGREPHRRPDRRASRPRVGAGEGLEGARRPDLRICGRRPPGLSEAGRPRMAPGDRVSCSSTGAGNPSVSATSVRWFNGMALPCCPGGVSPHTRSGTRSPRICWKEGPTSEPCRNCSGMRASRRRSDTRTSRVAGSSMPTSARTRGPEMATAKKVATKPAARARKAPAKNARAKTVSIPAAVDDELAIRWDVYKRTADGDAREADPALRAAREVRREPRRQRAAFERGSTRPRELRDVRADRRARVEFGRGNKFETYAIPRIKGAIIDELRAMRWVPLVGPLQGPGAGEGTGGSRGHAQASSRPKRNWPTGSA